MRKSIWLTCLFLLFAAGVHAATRPNLLIIIADDLNWRDLGCTGNPDVKTPNIDGLKRDGMTLRGMFTPAPTCSPCRHALYTGLFPVRSGAYPNHTMVDPGTKSVFTHLKEAGYRVGLQGKTHINPRSSFPYEYIAADPDNAAAFADFITADKSKPWMAVFASHDPHSPWTRGPKNMYDPAKLKVPPYLHDNEVTRKALAAYYAEITQLDIQVGACLKAIADAGQQDNTLVLFVSEQGSSFPYGGKWSLYDNGIEVASFARWPGHIKAGSSSDALMQYVDVAPTFLELAGLDPKKTDTGCTDANGDRGFDGRSFASVLLGKSHKLRDYVYSEHTTVGVNGYKEPYPSRAVRDSRYKLIRNLTAQNIFWIGGIHNDVIFKSWQVDAEKDSALARRVDWLMHRTSEELYDVQKDPYEMHNLADDPKYADIKARLSKELTAWMKQQGDQGLETEMKAPSRQPRNLKADGKPGAKKKKKKKKPADN